MFKLAVVLGIYSYLIFGIGLVGLLNSNIILLASVIYCIIVILLLKKSFSFSLALKLNQQEKIIAIVISLLLIVNFIGALGPELSFDALWYHLTIPKEFLESRRIFYIPGNLLYYSVMPMFTHMLYIPGLLVGGETLPKIIHFFFGVLTLLVIFSFSRLYLSRLYSMLAVLIFYSNLVVGWLSITAFADLPRAFFEVLALYLFAVFINTKERKYIYQSAIVLGLAVSAKVLSLPSITIYIVLLFIFERTTGSKFMSGIQYAIVSLLIVSPWFLFAFLNTGNPLFPIYSQYYTPSFSLSLFNPMEIIKSAGNILLFSQDPINPIYLIVLPLILVNFRKLFHKYLLIVLYVAITFLIWYITPQSGGGRFMAAYLPVYSILTAIVIKDVKQARKVLVGVVFIIAVITLIYRGVANIKFVPVILGNISKEEFLMDNLNFNFGDFYDEKSSVKKIVGSEKVLLVGLHNLYYVNFPHDHISWSKREGYRYVLTQGQFLEEKQYTPVYKNEKTHVTLYKLNDYEVN